MIKLNVKMIVKNKIISTMLDFKNGWKENKTNGRNKVKEWRNRKRLDCIIRRCRLKTKEMLMGNIKLTQFGLQPY